MGMMETGKQKPNGQRFSTFRYQPFSMPWFALIGLSSILIIFAAIPFILSPPQNIKAPVFTFWRNENGEFFAKEHLERDPLVYGWLHAIPGGVWCALMPFQFSKQIRRKYPIVHRWSGRSIIALSLLLGFTSMTFGRKNLIFSASTFHIHTIKIGFEKKETFTIFAWPSFRMLVWFLSPILLYSSIQTIRTARQKRYDLHQYWASVLTLFGYSIPMQRVMMLLFGMLFNHLSFLSNKQKEFLRIPKENASLVEKSNAERAAFSLTAWLAVVVMLIWSFIQSYRRNIELQKVQKSKS